MRKPLPDYKLRLPQELKDRIARAADDNNRSMNAEMVARLDASFRGTDQSAPPASELETLAEQVRALERKLNAIPADQLQAFTELMQGLKRGEVVMFANKE